VLANSDVISISSRAGGEDKAARCLRTGHSDKPEANSDGISAGKLDERAVQDDREDINGACSARDVHTTRRRGAIPPLAPEKFRARCLR
jgi:hypothetical protein